MTRISVVRLQRVNFHNSPFCPHSAFMCFVWISEQTAIISLYSIDWLVFITEKERVYCAVWIESLNMVEVNLCLQSTQHIFLTSMNIMWIR